MATLKALRLPICGRCRLSLSQFYSPNTRSFPARFRALSSKLALKPAPAVLRRDIPNKIAQSFKSARSVPSSASKVKAFFEANAEEWVTSPRSQRRLESFGIPRQELGVLLRQFLNDVQDGRLSTLEGYVKYGLDRFSDPILSCSRSEARDRNYTNIFFAWVNDPSNRLSLEGIISSETIISLQKLYNAADLSYPAEQFPQARAMHRKFIMHVGPTNSGKTHNALRALAAARVGVYSGPLRLLAHEIWERLNTGQIVPEGADLGINPASTLEPLSDTIAGDSAPSTVIHHYGDPKYSRKCNLVTGEERKIVDSHAGLTSCTVEMTPLSTAYDVAVVDEIQMISDPERGGGWTNAVLGLCAKEIHLCGEETAVPLIRKLLEDTGDELVVRRYERLTPLSVAEESLNGDLGLVQKGDCVLTFSRSKIFALKRKIEETTGLKCAVAYGRLPPELRSEQAALFNDPNSGYDVMIGSDAIGMGLNLKIKRVVFEAVRKWDGSIDRLLSLSQTKQIAGRAGRYGLHGNDSSGGIVTTLNPDDLCVVREAIDAPPVPINYARVSTTSEQFRQIAQALPPHATAGTIYEVYTYISKMRSIYRFAEYSRLEDMSTFIENQADGLTLEDKCLLMMAPISWREEGSMDAVERFVWLYQRNMTVPFIKSLEGMEFLTCMNRVEKAMGSGAPPKASVSTLETLETFHKVLVLYLWLSLRSPVAYADNGIVMELKGRLEKALDWCLQGVTWEEKAERRVSPEKRERPQDRRRDRSRDRTVRAPRRSRTRHF